MKSEKKTNKSYLILVVVILALLSLGYYQSLNKKEKLLDYNTTKGEIVEIQNTFQRGYYIKYSYKVGDKKYYYNQKLTIKKELISIGDVFEVKYSTEDESVSELNLKKKLNNE